MRQNRLLAIKYFGLVGINI